MSMKVSYKKQFVVLFFLFILFLSVIEGVARIYESNSNSYNCVFLNKDAFEGISNSFLNSVFYDYKTILLDDDPYHHNVPDQKLNTININSHGFRGEEISKTKSVDVFRIFMIGGSTVFGYGSTSDNTTIPSNL